MRLTVGSVANQAGRCVHGVAARLRKGWEWLSGSRARDPDAGPWSLRRRLITVVLTASLLMWIVSLGTMAVIAWQQTSDIFDDGLKEGARLIVETQSREGLQADATKVAGPEGGRVRLDYQLIVADKVVRRTGHAPQQPFVDDLKAGKEKGFRTVFTDGQAWRVFVLRSRDPAFEVQIGQPYNARFELLRELTENLIWPAVILLAILAGVTWLAIQRVMRPLDETARAIERKSADDLTPLGAAGRPVELQPMVDALNRVFGELAHAIEGERRFTADAAHELRTPLAALRMKTQLLQRQYPAQRTALQPLRDDVDRCTALVENLLILARLDHPDDLDRHPFQLNQLLDEVMQSRTKSASQKQIAVTNTAHGSMIPFDGHEALLKIALGNILDNSLRYCATGSHVRLESSSFDGEVQLWVRDDGPGVQDELLARLSERFFRVLGTGQSGSGLGLSIVARIAALHGGRLSFESGIDGKGLGVCLHLPHKHEGPRQG